MPVDLYLACQQGNVELVRRYLARGDSVEEETKWNRPIHAAANCHTVEVMRLVLEAGADPNSHDRVFMKPVHIAAQKGNIDMIRLLMEYGANIHEYDSIGRTALSYMCEFASECYVLQSVKKVEFDEEYGVEYWREYQEQVCDATLVKQFLQLGSGLVTMEVLETAFKLNRSIVREVLRGLDGTELLFCFLNMGCVAKEGNCEELGLWLVIRCLAMVNSRCVRDRKPYLSSYMAKIVCSYLV